MVEISLSGSGEGPGWETSRPTLQILSIRYANTAFQLAKEKAEKMMSDAMSARDDALIKTFSVRYPGEDVRHYAFDLEKGMFVMLSSLSDSSAETLANTE